jgi:hypothetical protein
MAAQGDRYGMFSYVGENTLLVCTHVQSHITAVATLDKQLENLSLSIRHAMGSFGGIVVNMLASGTQDRGFTPGQSRRIFCVKKSSACLPSKGK